MNKLFAENADIVASRKGGGSDTKAGGGIQNDFEGFPNGGGSEIIIRGSGMKLQRLTLGGGSVI